MTVELEVLATGPLTTVQDLGRPGQAALGVSRSGAADRSSASLANRLVGNPEAAACLEVTFGGLQLRATGDLVIAVTGADSPVTVDGGRIGGNVPVEVSTGQQVAFGTPTRGLRSYLAVRGGIAVEPVLGSRATDTLGQLGPSVPQVGDRLPVGDLGGAYLPVDQAAVRDPEDGEVELRIAFGPRDDWFTEAARQVLIDGSWMAAQDSSRIGVRLTGPELERAVTDELASEGLVRGAIQVPPDGPPTLFLADHPVTGGYPVIAVVLSEDVDRAAQVRPGQPLRFRVVTSPEPS